MASDHIQDVSSQSPPLTVAEVAEQLQTTPRTVQRWIKEGRLSAIRLPGGRSYRVYQRDVDAALTVIEASA